jgi:hypothetical protein
VQSNEFKNQRLKLLNCQNKEGPTNSVKGLMGQVFILWLILALIKKFSRSIDYYEHKKKSQGLLKLDCGIKLNEYNCLVWFSGSIKK